MSLGPNGRLLILTLMKPHAAIGRWGDLGLAGGVLIGSVSAGKPVHAHPFDPLMLVTVSVILIVIARLAVMAR